MTGITQRVLNMTPPLSTTTTMSAATTTTSTSTSSTSTSPASTASTIAVLPSSDPNANGFAIRSSGGPQSSAFTITAPNTNCIIYTCLFTKNTDRTLSVSAPGRSLAICCDIGKGDRSQGLKCWHVVTRSQLSSEPFGFAHTSGTVMMAFAVSRGERQRPVPSGVNSRDLHTYFHNHERTLGDNC